MSDAELLRTAAERLRDPYLCNWHIPVAHGLADAMAAVAYAIDLDADLIGRCGYPELVDTARAFLHTTGDIA